MGEIQKNIEKNKARIAADRLLRDFCDTVNEKSLKASDSLSGFSYFMILQPDAPPGRFPSADAFSVPFC